jgi:hypothetical protein
MEILIPQFVNGHQKKKEKPLKQWLLSIFSPNISHQAPDMKPCC